MMNHHLPTMGHGQPPMPPPPPPRRGNEPHYPTGPNSMRSPPGYMGYHNPHMNGHVPHAYAAQQYAPWYPGYPPMQHPPPPPPPLRPYQPQYAPMIVSSYPQNPPVPPSNVVPTIPMQPRSAASTPLQSSVSPPPSTSTPTTVEFPDSSSAALSTSSTANTSFPPSLTTEPVKGYRESFRAPLPWLSVPDQPFPHRVPHRRRSGRALPNSDVPVELPVKDSHHQDDTPPQVRQDPLVNKAVDTSVSLPIEPHTPGTSHEPSDTDSTLPTTPSSAVATPLITRAHNQVPTKSSATAVPIVPVVPILPPSPSTPRQQSKTVASEASTTAEIAESAEASENKPVSPPRPAAPKSWADLVRSKAQGKAAGPSVPVHADASGLAATRNETLVDVLNSLGTDVEHYGDKIAFLEPRGLVNTGNMCYMNSVLQILAFCVPFYQFLDYLGRRATHSIKTELPLIDSLIMFLKEFRVIDAARSEEQLRLRLKHNELEEYGEAFIPEFVYQVIRQLPRFRDMRRGHQQDAQEFLGFLLEELHEECIHALKAPTSTNTELVAKPESRPSGATEGSTEGWLEVGHKQKPAVTRSSGHIGSESPITKIFGGKIRSEFRVPGNKNSVTLEPYQPLQLDIGDPEVNNIVEALKGLTKPETIHGDFNSSRGPKLSATKQVFIETLPPVLILHLKRFHYDSATMGTQKIWKKVGYPLELEIPREVFAPHKRNAMSIHGSLPKYHLIGVIYHHGKNASGGHYTVDVRRQDGREWVRIDDTIIRRVRSEDVAEGGSEEDPKVLAAALEQHKGNKSTHANIYEQFDQDDQDRTDIDKGWSQVNGAGSGGHSSKKSVSSPANGTSSPSQAASSPGVRTPIGKYGSRDNKVAYLLFYQRVSKH